MARSAAEPTYHHTRLPDQVSSSKASQPCIRECDRPCLSFDSVALPVPQQEPEGPEIFRNTKPETSARARHSIATRNRSRHTSLHKSGTNGEKKKKKYQSPPPLNDQQERIGNKGRRGNHTPQGRKVGTPPLRRRHRGGPRFEATSACLRRTGKVARQGELGVVLYIREVSEERGVRGRGARGGAKRATTDKQTRPRTGAKGGCLPPATWFCSLTGDVPGDLPCGGSSPRGRG